MSTAKESLIELIKKYSVVTKSEYSLAHGTRSYYFFDVDKFAYDYKPVNLISDMYSEKILEIRAKDPRVDRLIFIEKDYGTIGALPFMSSIILKTRIETVVVRFRREISIGEIKGASLSSKNHAIIVSDVLTSSEGIGKAKRLSSKYGVTVQYAVVLYDRTQGGKQILKDTGIEICSILTKDDLVNGKIIKANNPYGEDTQFDKEEQIIPPAQERLKELEKILGKESVEVLRKLEMKG
jgi:orotate phosphoribosyltransferase